MSQGLPRHLRVLRDRINTAKNALDALERFEFASEWGAVHSEQKREAAIKSIESSVIAAADAIGCQPSEKRMFSGIIRRLQEDNQRLSEANAKLATQYFIEAKNNDERA